MVNYSTLTPEQRRIAEVYEMLRPYQKTVFHRLATEKRHLNYMDMGMGKSLVTLLAVKYLQAFPCIIVCPKSAMGVWETELKNWFDESSVLYVGKPKQREEAWKQFMTKGIRFIITNYALIGELGQRFGFDTATRGQGPSASGIIRANKPTPGTNLRIGAIVADEIQLGGLFNHRTKTYSIFRELVKGINYVYLLTGTPYRRGVIDFYGPLSLVDTTTFAHYWKFVSKYCRVIDTGFGKQIERNPKNVEEFRQMIRRYASILKKENYLHELPGKQRISIPIEMDDEQRKVYEQLTENLIAETNTGEFIITPTKLALMVRQRQLLVAPQELGLRTRGAAIETMLEMVESFVEKAKPFVIFTPFREAVKWIAHALEETYPRIRIYVITGGLTVKQFANEWQGFQNDKSSKPRVLICVIRSGASFHATVADTCFFLGYEWDFNQNIQAEDRLNRMGQKNMVTCYYLMHKGTVDEDIAQVLNDKKFSSDLVLSDEDTFRMLMNRLKGQRDEVNR